jgi:hypothetical protein
MCLGMREGLCVYAMYRVCVYVHVCVFMRGSCRDLRHESSFDTVLGLF